MTVNLNFNLEAWIKQLQIEADSEEEAKQKLMSMSLSEILSDDTLVTSSDFKISDVDVEAVEYTLTVQVSDIVYDLDPETMDVSVVEYLKAFLPAYLTVTLKNVTDADDVEDLIRDELYDATAYEVESFSFKVLSKK